MAQNVIRVPQGCPTVEKAMALAFIFSGRKEYTKTDPLKIRLEEGVHEIVGNQLSGEMYVTCNYITFVGKGKNQTTIRGGFYVANQQHVKFEELAIAHATGSGIHLQGCETNVEVLKCVVKSCRGAGMSLMDGATVAATQCEFMENGCSGVSCELYFGTEEEGAWYNAHDRRANGEQIFTKARLNGCTMHNNGAIMGGGLSANGIAVVVDLHGTKTDIHSNKRYGICAQDRAKVNIHLPSQHKTSHGNMRENRRTVSGGSIANINTEGTATHGE
jgi:hypothetical protein